jgi:hypothetical protein
VNRRLSSKAATVIAAPAGPSIPQFAPLACGPPSARYAWGIAAGRAISEALSQGHGLGLAAALLLPPLFYWLLLLPVVLWLGIRVPLRRDTLLRSLPVHVGAAALLAAGYAELMVRVDGQDDRERRVGVGRQRGGLAGAVSVGLPAYSFILSWGHVHEYFTALREREVEVTRLQAELAQAQLRAL